jgi:hypothetical protein
MRRGRLGGVTGAAPARRPLRRPLAAAIVGTAASRVPAAVGPLIAPRPGAVRFGREAYSTRDDGALRSVHHAGVGPDLSNGAAPRAVRSAPYDAPAPAASVSGRDFERLRGLCDAVDSGWPWRSLAGWRCEVRPGLFSGGTTERVSARGYFALAEGGGVFHGPLDERWVPFHPLWPGLLADAAAWSAAAWALLAGASAARRMRRAGRGRCPGCGHDRAGLAPSAACPECGRAPA